MKLAEIILDKDASYVGAYIAWAKTCPRPRCHAPPPAGCLADHFLNSRPRTSRFNEELNCANCGRKNIIKEMNFDPEIR